VVSEQKRLNTTGLNQNGWDHIARMVGMIKFMKNFSRKIQKDDAMWRGGDCFCG
jgi:hypothetical protein